MNQPTLAVALIVKNEEKHLAACLDTVHGWVDEIIILDAGSDDRTTEIAKQYTNNIYTNTQWPGFGPQRRLAQTYVTCDYVLWLDADERVTPELKVSIQEALQNNPDNTIYKINRLSSAFGQFIKHSGWSPDWLVRLYPTHLTQYNEAMVHEKVEEPQGITIKKLSGKLHHYTYDSLHQCINKNTKYIKIWADDKEGKKKSSLSTALLHAFASFLKMYVFRLGFLDGRRGFILAWLTMNNTFSKYADLWLRSHSNNQ
ncbi:glycosyltransferase family 2 protein [Vibrio rumoiensis]|uniref:Glycosyltransferase n=1 Tax=Vibrio rumoiensis 1S-45 TaxID=1188252 RepID=A0A1E5E635_9VIBR|nr:glycosyltransferase [Vibrio rumoiensis]OEF29476.1 glycosyltransferase [Vibrio rumoiensis 1S-45]